VHHSHIHLIAHRYYRSRLYVELRQVSPSSQSKSNVPSFYCVLKAFDDVILHFRLLALCTFSIISHCDKTHKMTWVKY